MTTVGLVSAKGAPGVTTSAVLLAAVWPGAVLLEADPAGGDLRFWYPNAAGSPLRADVGVVSLLTSPTRPTPSNAGRHSVDLTPHLQQLPGGLPVLVGPSTPGQVEALRSQWRQLAELSGPPRATHLAAPDMDVNLVMDLGALSGATGLGLNLPLLRSCDLILVVCRATVASLAHTRDLIGLLRDLNLPGDLLVLAPATARSDAAAAVDLQPARVHLLPFAPDHAAGVAGLWTRRLDRSPLLTATRALVTELQQRLTAEAVKVAPERGADPSRPSADPVPPADLDDGLVISDQLADQRLDLHEAVTGA
jgi:hypothetical protein